MAETRFGMTFEDWEKQLDKDLEFLYGFGSADLPDWGWWDLWDCGLTTAEAVQDYIDNNGIFV